MAFLGYIVIQVAVNAVTVLAAAYFIPGVSFNGDFAVLLKVAAILTAFNIFLKPIAKLFLGPFILLTFGLLLIFINAALLWLAAYWAPELAFSSPIVLLEAALLFAAANFAIGLARRAK